MYLLIFRTSLGEHSPYPGIRFIHLDNELESRIGWIRSGAEMKSLLRCLKAASALGIHMNGEAVEVSWVRGAAALTVVTDEPGSLQSPGTAGAVCAKKRLAN